MRWQPGKTEAHEADRERLSALFKSVDCIVNLAGENVGKKRWSQAVKDQILSSRIRSIELLGEALHLSGNKEATFLQTSAVGVYGDRLNQLLDDDAPYGKNTTFRIDCYRH